MHIYDQSQAKGWHYTCKSAAAQRVSRCGGRGHAKKKKPPKKIIVGPKFDFLEVKYRVLLEMAFFSSPNTFLSWQTWNFWEKNIGHFWRCSYVEFKVKKQIR